jgi:DNA-binding CsgD family transcriptional regulator/PAS domain-containing protein
MDQDRVLKLVEMIYDAAVDPGTWTPALQELIALTGGIGADLAAFNVQTSVAKVHVGVGIMNADFQSEYEPVVRIDPFLMKAQQLGLFRAGAIGIGEHIVPFRELERTDFYNDFGRRHDYVGGAVAIIDANKSGGAALGIGRAPDRLFGPDQVMLLRTLLPHLQRAWQLTVRLAESARRQSSLAGVLNHLSLGVLLVTNGGTVVFANDAAQALLSRRDGLVLDRGTLRGARSQDTSALNALIAGALATASSAGLDAGGVILLDRPSGHRPLRVIVSPLPPNEKLPTADPQAILFVTDPEDAPEPDQTILQRAYGLSPAETEIAALLMQDRSVTEIGEWLGISVNTVRFHLKQIFAKTGTARQSALVRLLSTTAHVLRIGNGRPTKK